MSEFVKKTMMGYREVPGGQSDPECTHVILTVEEHAKLLRKISAAEQQARTTRYEADREIEEEKREANRKAQQAAYEADQAIEEWKKALDVERAESAHQRALNANLLRIAKERANADRKLRPKKEHTGYGVVTFREKEYRYKVGNRHWRETKLWETVIQSPYTIDLPEELARKQIMDDLLGPGEYLDGLVCRIGINTFYPGSYENFEYDQEQREKPEDQNVMLEPHLQANGRYGYWEVVFFHTKPLSTIPKEMRINS